MDISGDWGAPAAPVEPMMAGDWGDGFHTVKAEPQTAPATTEKPAAVLPETPWNNGKQQADADTQADTNKAATASHNGADMDTRCLDTLKATWGAEFEEKLAVSEGIVDAAPQGISEFFHTFQFGDGTAISDMPEVRQWLHDIAPSSNAQLPDAPLEQTAPETPEQSAAILATSSQLQALWGDGWQQTLQGVRNLVYAAPPVVRELVLSAQYIDGAYVANDPLVLGWLAQYVHGGQSINDEIAQIESKFGSREYLRSESLQARLRSLYASRGR